MTEAMNTEPVQPAATETKQTIEPAPNTVATRVQAALASFLKADFKYNEVIPKKWFYDAFGLEIPDYKDMTGERVADLTWDFLRHFGMLKEVILKRHLQDLRNVRKEGYAIVRPQDQAAVAMTDAFGEATKQLRRATLRANNIRMQELSAEEQKATRDAQARLGTANNFVASIARKTKKADKLMAAFGTK